MARFPFAVAAVCLGLLLAAPLSAGGLTVSGMVQDPMGRPFHGARVELQALPSNLDSQRLLLADRSALEPLATGAPDTAGRFALKAPAAGVFEVVVRAEGHLSMRYSPLPVVQTTELPPVELRPAVAAAFEIVNSSGEPQGGLWVRAAPSPAADGWQVVPRFARTDSQGRITLPREPEERFDLMLFEPGGAVFQSRQDVTGGRLTFTPAQGTSTIEVRHADGSPAPGVLVAVGSLAWPAGETGADGRLLLHGRPVERTPVQLLAADGQRQLAWLAPGAERTEIVLTNLKRVSGRAVEAGSDRPLAGALVWPGHDPGSFVRTGLDGSFELPIPPEESWWVQLEVPGFQAFTARGTAAAVDAAEPDAPLSLMRAAGCRGRVTAPDGRPVPGARVVATPLPNAPPRKSFHADGAEARAATDPAGRFELGSLRPGIAYAIEVRADGWAPKRLPGARLREGAPADLGAIVLAREVRIEGRIVDRGGRAIAGATVRREGAKAVVSDARGRFAIRELGSGEEIDLLVDHPAYLPVRLPGVVAPGSAPLEVVLQRAARVAGWIVDETGQGVAEAAVTLRAPDTVVGVIEPRRIDLEASTTSDRDGRFEIDAVPPGLYEISVHAEGYLPPAERSLRVSAAAPAEELRVELARGATLAGLALTTGGEPLAGVRVRVASAAGVSDEEGHYQVEGILPGPQTVEAREPSRGGLQRKVRIEAGENHLDLVFDDGQRVEGRVVDEAGAPVSGAAIRLESFDGSELRASSGAAGRFAFPHVAKGRYSIHGARQGFAPTLDDTELVVADTPVEAVDIVLEHGATLTGTIRGLAVEELAIVDLTAERQEGGGASGGVEAGGTFEIPGLAPGTWHVRATLRNGAREATGTVEVARGARQVALDLEFRRGLTLAGRVFYSGAPLAGAAVTVTAHGLPFARQVSTAYDGRFQVLDLEPGWYRVEITHPAEMLTELHDLQLARDEELAIDITTAQVSGRVVSGQEPVGEALVILQRLLSAGDGGLLAVGTDSRGAFRLARVTEGRYRLTIRKAGYAPLVQELEVQAGIELAPLELSSLP
jgi:protocatechuate 3,4-dioxygenase beta subunit